MPYTPTTWTNGSTPANATNMSNLETQYNEAIKSFEQDLFTPFVYSGYVATKDGVTANKLDVTAGVAFLLQADLTLRRRAQNIPAQTTSVINTTYYLYFQPDGTTFWSTSNTPAANSLFIAQVTTDASGNIATVTDKRVLATTLFSGMAGTIVLGGQMQTFFPVFFENTVQWASSLSIDATGSSVGTAQALAAAPTLALAAGTNLGIGVYKYAVSYVSANGESLPGTQGSITTTTGNQAVNLSAIPTGPVGTTSRHIWRTKVGGSTLFLLTTLADNTTTTFADTTTDASLPSTTPLTHPTMGGDVWKSSGGSQVAAIFADGAISFDTGKITSDGNGNLFAVGFQTNRNGTLTPVATYTGTTTPSGDGVTTPQTGAIWVKA